MGWTLVVSESDTFQRAAISHLRDDNAVVGATGDSAARSLVRAVDVERILVDARDDVGRRFLSTLRSLPGTALPNVEVVVVGDVDARFQCSPTLETALPLARGTIARRSAA